MLTKDEIEQIKSKGISEDEFNSQIDAFKKGFPSLDIVGSATLKNGVVKLTGEQTKKSINIWKEYQQSTDHKAVAKFVPASGAASRMFKNLYEYLANAEETDFIKIFFGNISRFPFFHELDVLCVSKENKHIHELVNGGEGGKVIEYLLTEKGLNFGFLPKGLLPFHLYADMVRTPFDEHLEESALYTMNKDGDVNLHFTVSEEHLSLFKDLLGRQVEAYKKRNAVKNLKVSFSMQDSSTDTVAVDMNNNPIKIDGKLLFRPGGHGSLLKNLNSFDNSVDVVFIKNIDNVVPETRREPVIESTEALAGYFLTLRNKLWEYEALLDKDVVSHSLIDEIVDFCENKLFISNLAETVSKNESPVAFLKNRLHRPFRVCGMVRNSGEPGGGPYFCKNEDQTISLQILERNQICDDNEVHMAALRSSTHFNPVNMVCGLYDYKGEKFDLNKYTDPNTAFISIKSKNGISLKALEHPGLWNGAMSNWITVFVEMEENTFNPVKTVNDLLRPMHQNK